VSAEEKESIMNNPNKFINLDTSDEEKDDESKHLDDACIKGNSVSFQPIKPTKVPISAVAPDWDEEDSKVV